MDYAKFTLKIDDINTILKRRGLEKDGKVQKKFTNEVDRFSDPYVPMSCGNGVHMKNYKQITVDSIKYTEPYSKYQYYGKVMEGKAPKKVTDKDLEYNEGPKRGARWEKRMWENKGQEIVKELEGMIGI
ncbi:MAG: minor capsid protein [Clostridia bacterium]